ncbi:hypothetical protein [Sulfurimonas sp.]
MYNNIYRSAKRIDSHTAKNLYIKYIGKHDKESEIRKAIITCATKIGLKDDEKVEKAVSFWKLMFDVNA